MKRAIFVVIFLVLISIPILTEANDSLETEQDIPVSQEQELKLHWYKNMNYTFGYNIGLC
ncbi:MAG: hypothetical protein GWP03_07035 [Proteobacteria bacterium]|nr:hypothetical protein [Pseudomonadota bacterium]